MAISTPHYNALKELHRRGELPQGGSILEIGEANFYGDMPREVLIADIEASPHHAELLSALEQAERAELPLFAIAKVIYAIFCRPRLVSSIDKNGTPSALRLDLNDPIKLNRKYDLVINHGTAEHIFNIANVFRVIHDHCELGGLMIHESPYTGWPEHGFYNLNQTLFYDVAAVNGYAIRYFALEQLGVADPVEIETREEGLKMAKDGLPYNAMLYVAMRKMRDSSFQVPMQGYYDNTISDEARQAWSDLR